MVILIYTRPSDLQTRAHAVDRTMHPVATSLFGLNRKYIPKPDYSISSKVIQE